MRDLETEHLRVLIANEHEDHLADIARITVGLGHEVIARPLAVDDVGHVTAREHPDVVLVVLGDSTGHALELIDRFVHEAACPVIALLHSADPVFVREAARRGIFAYINESADDDWQSAIDITLARFTEYNDLDRAFGRRALIERAKGVLMERHAIDENAAFDQLREYARAGNRKLIDLAAAVVDGHRLLPARPQDSPWARFRLKRRATDQGGEPGEPDESD